MLLTPEGLRFGDIVVSQFIHNLLWRWQEVEPRQTCLLKLRLVGLIPVMVSVFVVQACADPVRKVAAGCRAGL